MFFHIAYAMGAAPMGIPGWPLFAFCIASADKTLIVSIDSLSIVFIFPPKNGVS